MKFIKNGIIFEPHTKFVEEQMIKHGYEEYKEVETKKEEPKEEPKVEPKEKKKK